MTTMTREQALDRIIWSADDLAPVELYSMLDMMPGLRRIKLDRKFVRLYGDDPIAYLGEQGYEVFNDAKLIEVTSKIVELTKIELETRPWMLNIMAGATSTGELEHPNARKVDALKQFADLCREASTLSCGVTVLTSKEHEHVEDEFNGRSPIEQVLWYAELLIQCGFTDMVCSPQEARAIIEEFGNAINTNTPSIRLPDDAPDDQARTMTPTEAIKAGASRLVIGRPISKVNPAENLEKIITALCAV